MALADKCYLHIPFKDYLKSLRVDREGKLRQRDLDRVASMEYENYKAIERRINDASCQGGGSCCSAAYTGTGTSGEGLIEPDGFLSIEANPFVTGDLYDGDTDGTLPAGLYNVSGIVIYAPTADPSGGNNYVHAAGPSSDGGRIAGRHYNYETTATNNSHAFTYAGTIWQTGAWTPGITVYNELGASISAQIEFAATRVCAPCDLSIATFL